MMATFVLVPGACHGAWCYSRVAGLLRDKGHDVYAVALTGVGELAHLSGQAINLSTHVQDVTSVIRSHDLTDVILCGHSYGGVVITGVAGQVGERIRTLFYLDALVPESGQSSFDLVGPERSIELIDAAGDDGIMVAAPKAEFFNVNPRDVAWVDAHCTPHPVGTFIQKLHFTGKEALVSRRTFVVAGAYPSPLNHATCERLGKLPGWKTASVDCGHDIMIDAPEALTNLLIEEIDR